MGLIGSVHRWACDVCGKEADGIDGHRPKSFSRVDLFTYDLEHSKVIGYLCEECIKVIEDAADKLKQDLFKTFEDIYVSFRNRKQEPLSYEGTVDSIFHSCMTRAAGLIIHNAIRKVLTNDITHADNAKSPNTPAIGQSQDQVGSHYSAK